VFLFFFAARARWVDHETIMTLSRGERSSFCASRVEVLFVEASALSSRLPRSPHRTMACAVRRRGKEMVDVTRRPVHVAQVPALLSSIVEDVDASTNENASSFV